MEMCGVCSLVFFVVMGAAKVGCRSSCTRSKSQADNGELPEQNLQHEVNLNFLSQDNLTIIWILLQKPGDLRSF